MEATRPKNQGEVKVPRDNLIGVATCDECSSRVRVLEKHRAMLGKAVRCPKCHSSFRLEIEAPTDIEVVAMESEKEAEKADAKPSRRTKSQIRREYIDQCREGFRTLHSRLKSISDDPHSSEEQIRVWVMDVLRTALGYEDCELDTECRALGKRVDVAAKDGNIIYLVLECKNIRSRLRKAVRDQAGNYASTLSAPWAVVTNGDIWKLYRVTPVTGREPRMDLVFDLALLDDDGVSEADAEHLYLLSKRGLTMGDTEKEFHQVIATSPSRLYKAMFSDRVLSAVRLQLTESYKKDIEERVKLDDEEVRAAVHDLLTPLEF